MKGVSNRQPKLKTAAREMEKPTGQRRLLADHLALSVTRVQCAYLVGPKRVGDLVDEIR